TYPCRVVSDKSKPGRRPAPAGSARCRPARHRRSVMEYRVLGRTGVRVSTLCLGAMMFGSWGADEKDSRRIIDAGLDAGINIIDTADVYSQGESESIVGAALAGRRDSVVLAT